MGNNCKTQVLTGLCVSLFRRMMLSALILVVFLLCYCCHRNTNKNLHYWQEQSEIFTVDEQVSYLAIAERKYPLSAAVRTHWIECDTCVSFWRYLKPPTSEPVQLTASHDPTCNVRPLSHYTVSVVRVFVGCLLVHKEVWRLSHDPTLQSSDQKSCPTRVAAGCPHYKVRLSNPAVCPVDS
jgi:hypothetical protein